jgi:transposase-like protein
MRKPDSPTRVAAELQRLKPLQWTKTDAQRVLAFWRASGRPLETFAHEHGLVPQRLRRWRQLLADKPEPAPLRLVPAVVVADAPRPLAPARPPVVVHAARACTVEVGEPAQVSPEWVAALVLALGTAP